jgi:methionyl-tRNA formyltransferase
VRLVFAGTPEVAVPTLDAVLASSHEVVAVVTRPDAAAGRGRRTASSPVARRALEAGVEVLKPATVRDPELLARLTYLAPDCCPVVAYGALVPPTALALPSRGWVNLHFSLLPAWRGAAPVQHAILHGDELTGATTFRLDPGMDTGPVYGVLTETVLATDTSGDLLGRLAESGAGLMVATLDGIESGELVPVPQPSHGASLAPKLTVEDARVDWSQPAFHVDRLVRACTPAPGPWTTVGEARLKLGPVRRVVPPSELARALAGLLSPGELLVGRSSVLAGCGDGAAVELGDVQPPGRRAMPAQAWARGLRGPDGGRLG